MTKTATKKVEKDKLQKNKNMREEIMYVATRQLRNGGYSELNFKTIAEELDTTRANLHYHFANKENLAIEVLEFFGEQAYAELNEIAEKYKNNFSKFISAMEDKMWQHFIETQGEGFCPCSAIMVSQHKVPAPVIDKADEYYLRMQTMLEEQIKAAQKSGNIKSKRSYKDLAKEAKMLLFGALQMGRSMYKDDLEHSPLRSVIKKWAQAL